MPACALRRCEFAWVSDCVRIIITAHARAHVAACPSSTRQRHGAFCHHCDARNGQGDTYASTAHAGTSCAGPGETLMSPPGEDLDHRQYSNISLYSVFMISESCDGHVPANNTGRTVRRFELRTPLGLLGGCVLGADVRNLIVILPYSSPNGLEGSKRGYLAVPCVPAALQQPKLTALRAAGLRKVRGQERAICSARALLKCSRGYLRCLLLSCVIRDPTARVRSRGPPIAAPVSTQDAAKRRECVLQGVTAAP